MVITPGAPVRSVPERLNVCEAELVSTVTFPKSFTVPAVNDGVAAGTPVPLTATDAFAPPQSTTNVKTDPRNRQNWVGTTTTGNPIGGGPITQK